MATKSDDTLVSCGEAQKSSPDDQIQDEKNNRPGPPSRPHSHPRLCASVDTIPVVKRGRANFAPAKQTRLRNSLLGVVGFLELANAGDFSANVWNEVPVPTHAVILMAIGGTFALLMSVFAFRDALLSWPNVCLLREQRRRLLDQRAERLKEEGEQQARDLDVLLDVTWRELGTEAINRFGLDLLLGAGAVMIGVGTLMAIGGANKKVWFASNLLSGYVGNTPLALYALINCAWACYVCTRTGQYRAAAAASLRGKQQHSTKQGLGDGQDHPAWAAVRRRARNVRLFAAITSVASILGGAGSMMTATMWYGYVILIPVIVSSVLCNVWWRHGLGYDRPPFFGDDDDARDSVSAGSLMSEMEFVALAQDAFRRDPETAAAELGADLESLESVVGFMVANDLFEDFCLRLLRDRELAPGLFPVDRASFDIEAAGLLEAARQQHREGRVLAASKKCVRKEGLRQFQSRERYLAEALMTCLYMSHSGT